MHQKAGPIIVIEDDSDDQEFMRAAFQELAYPNEILFFFDGYKALSYIESTDVQPFLILSDINMPRINGLELKRKIYNNEELKVRCIPYLFFTTGQNKQAVFDAYSMSAQGFFIKPASAKDLRETLRKIIEYWTECFSPSQYME
jgi:CheY-like chemotaxis protein